MNLATVCKRATQPTNEHTYTQTLDRIHTGGSSGAAQAQAQAQAQQQAQNAGEEDCTL